TTLVSSIRSVCCSTPRWFECGGTRESEDIAWFFIWHGCRDSLLKVNRCCKQHDACYLKGTQDFKRNPNYTDKDHLDGFALCNRQFDDCLYPHVSLIPVANSPIDHMCNAIYAVISLVVWGLAPYAYVPEYQG
ncbi:hypothetical protein PRIPAC_71474, partial [Pristionchus pacificus]|uniref:Uncharacterized protein n=1 Tax=Pristionchus pacificus TaxID=54126 RepID=A0A2A6C7U6_PRIPA